jgi:hypothetical protein
MKESGLNVPVYAVVKEDELPPPIEEDKMRGTAEFQDKYFCGPMYLDMDKEFYKYFGNKGIFSSLGLFNPFSYGAVGDALKGAGIEGNLVGDGITKGGVLVIDPEGTVLYKFDEDPPNGVPDAPLQEIIEAASSISAKSNKGGGGGGGLGKLFR